MSNTTAMQRGLPKELWSVVAQALLDQEADAALGTLAQTSRVLYDIAMPKLYDTVRIRDLGPLESFLKSMKIIFPPLVEDIPATGPATSSLLQNRFHRRLDPRTLVRHFEFAAYPLPANRHPRDFLPTEAYTYLKRYWDNDMEILAPLPANAFPNVETCFVDTISGAEESHYTGKIDLQTMFICLVLTTFRSKHLKWQHHDITSSNSRPGHSLLLRSLALWSRYRYHQDPPLKPRVLQLPSAWRTKTANDARNQMIYHYHYARDLSDAAVSGGWYTNAGGNEEDGIEYAKLKAEKSALKNRYIRPTFVVQLGMSPVMPPDYIEWHNPDLWRAIAGHMTDFAVMSKMDLVNVKVVSLPERQTAAEWRRWLQGDAMVDGGDVQADLKAVLERIKPGVERRPYEETLDYKCIRDLANTVDLFIDVAFRRHGLSRERNQSHETEQLRVLLLDNMR